MLASEKGEKVHSALREAHGDDAYMEDMDEEYTFFYQGGKLFASPYSKHGDKVKVSTTKVPATRRISYEHSLSDSKSLPLGDHARMVLATAQAYKARIDDLGALRAQEGRLPSESAIKAAEEIAREILAIRPTPGSPASTTGSSDMDIIKTLSDSLLLLSS